MKRKLMALFCAFILLVGTVPTAAALDSARREVLEALG